MFESIMWEIISNIFTAILVICAVITTGIVIRQEFFSEDQVTISTERYLDSWEQLMLEGYRVGDSNAPVQVAYYYDYQCPFCKQMDPVLSAIRHKYGSFVSIVYKHLPLEKIHPAARNMAIGAECAREQSFFSKYHSYLVGIRDSLPLTSSMDTIAHEAGIPDLQKFLSCVNQDAINDRIERDISLASSSGAGTLILMYQSVSFLHILTICHASISLKFQQRDVVKVNFVPHKLANFFEMFRH